LDHKENVVAMTLNSKTNLISNVSSKRRTGDTERYDVASAAPPVKNRAGER